MAESPNSSERNMKYITSLHWTIKIDIYTIYIHVLKISLLKNAKFIHVNLPGGRINLPLLRPSPVHPD
jgi:hypothetical protein